MRRVGVILVVLILVLALGTHAQGTQTSYITALEYSHDGNLIAVGYGATAENPCGTGFADPNSFGIHILNRDLESQIKYLNECTVSDFAFSPADTELAIATYIGREIILDLQTGEPLQINDSQGVPFIALTWSNSGAYLRASDRNIVRRHVVSATEAMPWFYEFHQDIFTDIDFSPDDAYVVSSSVDGTAVVWAIADKQISLSYVNHTAPIRSVDWSPVTSTIATGDESGQINIWSSTTGQTYFAIQGHSGAISALEWSPDGTRLATASEDGTVKVWNVETVTLLKTLTYPGPVYALDWSPDGTKLAYGGADLSGGVPEVTIVDVADIGLTPEATPVVQPTRAEITAIAWHPNGELIAYTYSFDRQVCKATGSKIYLIEVATGSPVSTFSAGRCTMESLDWSPDGKKLAGASGDKAGFRVWDINTGKLLSEAQLISEGAISIRWHPTRDLLLVGGVAGDAYLFNPDTGELIERLRYGGSFSDWSPSGNYFLTGSYNTNAYVVDATSNEVILTLPGHTAPVGMVDWSPDGSKLATSSYDGTVRLWNAVDGELMSILEVIEPYDMKWNPDSNRLAVASLDGFVQIWDVNTEEIIATYSNIGSVLSVAWSPDGTKLAYGGADLSGNMPEVTIVDVADIGLMPEATQEAMPTP